MLDTYKFIEKYKRISIIGMEKNVGKTTLLNKLIADIGKTKKLGLTSIGRDGEDIDVVTNTDKPRIYVRKGSIIATGRDCLSKCDITKEILYVTNFTTPMGSIVLVRALSDGYVDIAGPSYNKQVKIIVELMEKFGSEISIVDGALGRSGDKEDALLITSLSLAQKISNKAGKINYAEAVVLGNFDEITSLAKTISNDEIAAKPVAKVSKSEGYILEKIKLLMALVSLVILLITSMCVNTTLSAILLSRSKEIALLRAIGASKKRCTKAIWL